MSESNKLGKTTIVAIGELKVVCSELTVAQVRQMLGSVTAGDLADELLIDELRLPDIPLFTNLSAGDIEAMLPSELEQVVQGCKEANPSFFRMLAKLGSLRSAA